MDGSLGIGRRIREQREAAGYTQAQFAELVGVGDTTLCKIERGQRGLDSLTLRRISRQLDVPMDRFFGEEESLVLARAGGDEQMSEMLKWAYEMNADLAAVREEAARRYGQP